MNNQNPPSNPPFHSDSLPKWGEMNRKRKAIQVTTGVRMLPASRYEYWMDVQGNLIHLVVDSTRDQKHRNNNYGIAVRTEAIRAGFIPWEYKNAMAYHPGLALQHGGKDGADWDAFVHAEQERRQALTMAAYQESQRMVEGKRLRAQDDLKTVFKDAVMEIATALKAEDTPPKSKK